MNTNKLTTVFGAIFASTQFEIALKSLATNGLTFDGVWTLAGAVAATLWAFYTNRPESV